MKESFASGEMTPEEAEVIALRWVKGEKIELENEEGMANYGVGGIKSK